MNVLERLLACTGIDWEKHGVTVAECEQVFFNRPLLARPDEGHSSAEVRFYLLGKADSNRQLFVVFTIRDERIRVISARDQSRKEHRSYERYGEES